MQKTEELFHKRTEQKIVCEYSWSNNSLEVGQFWRYYDGVNIGNEISKDKHFKRVWLVLNNNLWNGLVLIAPLTTKNHHWMWKYYIQIHNRDKYNLKDTRVILNQIKAIDKKRFVWKLSEKKISNNFCKKVLFNYTEKVLWLFFDNKKHPDYSG